MKYDSKHDTIEHMLTVAKYISTIITMLSVRIKRHDKSKLESPEKEIFDIYTPKLKNTTYGSSEYKKNLKEMKVALDHHYSDTDNTHHPEHFKNGIRDMNLVDLIEMLCDWKAATLRHADGDILKSIEVNQKRFKYSNDIKQILINTVKGYF